MKKVFVLGKVQHENSLPDSELSNVVVIAKREGGKLVTNFDMFPERAVKMTFQESTGRVTLEFQLMGDEYIAIGDKTQK